MEKTFLFYDTRHPREGGDPENFAHKRLKRLDPRLRGDDGDPMNGNQSPSAMALREALRVLASFPRIRYAQTINGGFAPEEHNAD
ncbi:hypothetical protein [Azospirillum sp. sgz302134]